MNHLHWVDDFVPDRPTAITVGTFDGLHRGHQFVFGQLARRAHQRRLRPLMVTFHPHPRLVVEGPSSSLRLLTTLEEKDVLTAQMPVQEGVVFPFTEELATMPPQAFAEELIHRLRPQLILVGYDHRFGRGRRGTVETWQRVGRAYGVEVWQAPPVEEDDMPISSSRIRKLLLDAQVEQANHLLGYPYLIMGRVIRGKGWGRTIGYPTVNIQPLDSRKLIPAAGVYSAWVEGTEAGKRLPAMLYIGPLPPFNQGKPTIEAHIFDYEGDLYDAVLRVQLIRYFRRPVAVTDPQALQALLAEDEKTVRASFGISSGGFTGPDTGNRPPQSSS